MNPAPSPTDLAPNDVTFVYQQIENVIHSLKKLPLHTEMQLAKVSLSKDTATGGKYWCGTAYLRRLTLQWGRSGTNGQTRTLPRDQSDHAALEELRNRAIKKIQEGYALDRAKSSALII